MANDYSETCFRRVFGGKNLCATEDLPGANVYSRTSAAGLAGRLDCSPGLFGLSSRPARRVHLGR